MRCFILGLAATVFSIVAIIHALRIYYKWPIVINNWHAPDWASIVGLILAGFLAIGLFSILKCEK